MRIVIDIPEVFYEYCKAEEGAIEVHLAIKNGTPLPKGHGRLIDADAIRESIRESVKECVKWADEVKEGEMYARVSQSIGTFVECSLRIKKAPTIIEADKAESEE